MNNTDAAIVDLRRRTLGGQPEPRHRAERWDRAERPSVLKFCHGAHCACIGEVSHAAHRPVFVWGTCEVHFGEHAFHSAQFATPCVGWKKVRR